ncbi:hypothetical protein SynWH8103_01014 [Synechococcus sp. WH 8103]|nr:hypothetical protein SynWH8103_01014 [Synechococcus sp. WH 8103]
MVCVLGGESVIPLLLSSDQQQAPVHQRLTTKKLYLRHFKRSWWSADVMTSWNSLL